MLSKETKDRILKDSIKRFPENPNYKDNDMHNVEQRQRQFAYRIGVITEMERSGVLVEAMEKISDYTDDIFLVDPLNQAALSIRKEIEQALTKYNNSKKG